MNQLSIKASLIVGALISALIFFILAGVSLYSLHKSSNVLEGVYEHSVVPSSILGEIDKNLERVRFNMAAVMFDKVEFKQAEDQLDQVKTSLPDLWQKFKQARGSALSPEEKKLIEQGDKQLADFEPFYKLLKLAYSTRDKTMARSVLDEDWLKIEENLLRTVVLLVDMQKQGVKSAYVEGVGQAQGMNLLVVATLIVGALISLVTTALVVRSINLGICHLERALAQVSDGNLNIQIAFDHKNELGRMARNLETALAKLRTMISGVVNAVDTLTHETDQLSLAAQNVERSSSVQVDAASSTAASMEQMAASIEQVAGNSQYSLDISRENQALCAEGKRVVEEAVREIGDIYTAIEKSSVSVQSLGQRSGEIGQVIQVIAEIAEQTNLLALNAAIEAARAGEQGRGFAVVADEVRKLAERTQTATAEIDRMITGIQSETQGVVGTMEQSRSKINSGVRLVNEASSSLAKIDQGTNTTAAQAGEIAVAAREQSKAGVEVSQNMERIVEMSHETRQSVTGLSSTIASLKSLAAQLRLSAAKFAT
ncbi:MAG: methyl-accepting chemotaxis protein [Burkholderiales bacterium]